MHDSIKNYEDIISAIKTKLEDQKINLMPKIIAVSMTALISCIGLMYLIGWRGDTALFGGMLAYLVMGAVWCMFDSAKHTAKMKEKYPDLEL